MRRASPLSALLLFAATTASAADWSGLWHTADQRGERLLQSGDAAAAARAYADPRRKAYAELKAGDYAAAARDFAAFDDSDGQYNRGNALAHAGDLQSALKAYDAALASDPHDQDARHNRDLVARALEQQQHSQQQGQSGKDSGNKNGDKNASSQNSSGGSHNQDADHKNEQGAQSSGKDEQQSGQNHDQDKANQTAAANDQNKNQSQASDAQAQEGDQKQQGEESARTRQSKQASARSQPQSADNPAEARRDAEASLSKTQMDKSVAAQASGDGSRTSSAKAAGATQLSEQQLAEDQWLRRIPDDPGGLLRRKFLIEHMLRQQQTQP